MQIIFEKKACATPKSCYKSAKLLIVKDRPAFWPIWLEYLLGKITSFHDIKIVILRIIFGKLTVNRIAILTYVSKVNLLEVFG